MCAEKIERHARDAPSVCIPRSNQAPIAQIIDDTKGATLAQASSMDAHTLKGKFEDMSKTAQAKEIGKLVAQRAVEAGIEQGSCLTGPATSTPAVSLLWQMVPAEAGSSSLEERQSMQRREREDQEFKEKLVSVNRVGVPDPIGVAVDQVGHIRRLHLGRHLGPGHLAAVEQIDAIEVHDVTALDILLVHQPVAATVDHAHVDLELLGQSRPVHLLVAVYGDLVEIGRRVDMGPLGRARPDEGTEPAERPSAGVLGGAAITVQCDPEFHFVSLFLLVVVFLH